MDFFNSIFCFKYTILHKLILIFSKLYPLLQLWPILAFLSKYWKSYFLVLVSIFKISWWCHFTYPRNASQCHTYNKYKVSCLWCLHGIWCVGSCFQFVFWISGCDHPLIFLSLSLIYFSVGHLPLHYNMVLPVCTWDYK